MTLALDMIMLEFSHLFGWQQIPYDDHECGTLAPIWPNAEKMCAALRHVYICGQFCFPLHFAHLAFTLIGKIANKNYDKT